MAKWRATRKRRVVDLVRLASVLALGAAAFVAVGPSQTGAPTAAALATDTTQQHTYTNASCNHDHKIRDVVDCDAVVLTPTNHVITPDVAGPPPGALGPADIQSAYHLPAGAGSGQTIGIVDAMGDSDAESDLATFRAQYGLPPCTTANGCFRKVDQNGGTDYPPDDPGWGLETSLDLDAVSSACPNCNILLVEANTPNLDPTAGTDDLGIAADTAVTLGAKFVSNSYGAGDADATTLDHFYSHPGVVVTASTGDVGNQVNWPSSNPDVVAVGGTTLTKDASTTRGWTEAAWSSGGSGCSTVEPKPAFQAANGVDTDCPNRATADISADADPNSGLATFDTLGQSGWLQVGGTSLASPLIASMYALAGTPAPNTFPVTYPYDPTKSSDLNDITSGSDGTCGDLLCQAGPGWDGPTGLGTPNGVAALTTGAHGDIAGVVTDAATGAPLADATISTPDGYQARTDSTGHYDINTLVGTYTVSATDFAYSTVTDPGIQVSDGQTTTLNFSLQRSPDSVVTGTVTDGSGQGWPLYAKITIDGFPGGPIYTNPETGQYSVTLAQQGTYTMHVTPVYEPGYLAQTSTFTIGSDPSVTEDAALTIDATACTAPGYGLDGTSAGFTDWTGDTPRDGWTIQGNGPGWRFDNPGLRTPPLIPNGAFAIADSNFNGSKRMDTSLVSPNIDLSGQNAPELDFDTAYYGTSGSQASVDLSLNGGRTWAGVWRQGSQDAVEHVTVAIPQAAHQSSVRVRFHYTAGNAWWWGLDNVFVGTPTCAAQPGSLVEGVVSDTSGNPVVGATISSVSDPAQSAISVATPDDPNTPDGFYWLFASLTGAQQFTATDNGFTAVTNTVTLQPNQITQQNWTLASSS